MSVRMSPVTTFICGGWPPTPLGQEKPVPCMEHVHLMGSWMMRGRAGAEVTVPEDQKGWLTARLLPAPATGDSMRVGWLARQSPGDQEGPRDGRVKSFGGTEIQRWAMRCGWRRNGWGPHPAPAKVTQGWSQGFVSVTIQGALLAWLGLNGDSAPGPEPQVQPNKALLRGEARLTGTPRGPWSHFCEENHHLPAGDKSQTQEHPAQVIPLTVEKVVEFQARSRSSSTDMG